MKHQHSSCQKKQIEDSGCVDVTHLHLNCINWMHYFFSVWCTDVFRGFGASGEMTCFASTENALMNILMHNYYLFAEFNILGKNKT